MQKPIKNYIHRDAPKGSVSQWFSENHALYFSRMKMQGHNGIDIVAPHGTPIYAVEGGTVVDVKNSPDGYGKHLRIVSDTGREWTYGHASENLVKIGDVVKEGDEIQKMGNTGFVVSSTDGNGFWKLGSNKWAGTHLHLGVRNVLVSTKKKSGYWQYNANTPYIKVLNYDNGYFGSVNFADLLTDDDIPETPPTKPKFERNLTIGDRGEDVVALQDFLKEKGYFPENVQSTGYFGKISKASLAKFQKDNGINPSLGYFGELTRAFISDTQ